jgi:hypothetical protein
VDVVVELDDDVVLVITVIRTDESESVDVSDAPKKTPPIVAGLRISISLAFLGYAGRMWGAAP